MLRELFRAHVDFVWRVLRGLGVPDSEVDDAVQEVFLVVARQLTRYEERGVVRAWLFSIARRVAQHSHRARLQRKRTSESAPALAALAEPHHVAERNQALALLRRFLASLGEGQAEVFYLAEVEGLTMPEIAAALQIKLNTAYARLRLARNRFDAFVATHGDPGGLP